jgi:hypothetical protein
VKDYYVRKGDLGGRLGADVKGKRDFRGVFIIEGFNYFCFSYIYGFIKTTL